MALREAKPADLTDTSTAAEKDYFAKWEERSNRLSLLAIGGTIPEHFMSGLPETTDASVFLATVVERYKINKNAEAGTLMCKLTGMSYNSAAGVRAYILGMIGVRDKLKYFEIPIPDSFIINHTLNSLPPKFSQLKTAFNTQNEGWTLDELISKCDAEEKKLEREGLATAMLVSHPKPNPRPMHHTFHKGKDFVKHGGNFKPKNGMMKPIKCYFCKKIGHMKNCFLKFKVWLEKQDKAKGNPLAHVCFESKLVNVPSNSWLLDSGATVHVAFTLQGFTNKRSPKELERTLRVANNAEAEVAFIGDVSLNLESGFTLVLNNTFYVPSFRRNLISTPLLDKLGYCVTFGNFGVNLSINSTNI